MGFNNSVPPGFMPPDNGPLPGFGGGPGFVPVEVIPDGSPGKPLPQVPFGPTAPVTPFAPYPQQPTYYQPTKSSGGCLATLAGVFAVLMLSCLGGSIVIAKMAHRIQRDQQRQREFEVESYPLLPDRSGIDDLRDISDRMRRDSEERMEEMRRGREERMEEMRRWSEENRRQMHEDLDRMRFRSDF